MEMPPDLEQALAGALEGVSRVALGQRAARISALYREGRSSAHALRDDVDVLAYAVARLPATFAAVSHALTRLAQRCPGFAPRSVADLGAGPGTASWAAAAIWPAVETIVQVDVHRGLLALGHRLSASAPFPALRQAQEIARDLTQNLVGRESSELVVLSYTLAELPGPRIGDVVGAAWDRCVGALVLVEPGTPQGYARILTARERLLAAGARVLAPCPHQLPCPLVDPDWCHFAERLARSRDQRMVKSARLSFEDEKFSYLVVVREPLFSPAGNARILMRPAIEKVGARLKLCMPQGSLWSGCVPKRSAAQFHQVKKKKWGEEADPGVTSS